MNQGTSQNNQDSSVSRNRKMKFRQSNYNNLKKSKLFWSKNILSDENPTIVCLQETWWPSPTVTNFKGYEVTRMDQEKTRSHHSKGGEVAILINENHFRIAEILDLTGDMINLEVVILYGSKHL